MVTPGGSACILAALVILYPCYVLDHLPNFSLYSLQNNVYLIYFIYHPPSLISSLLTIFHFSFKSGPLRIWLSTLNQILVSVTVLFLCHKFFQTTTSPLQKKDLTMQSDSQLLGPQLLPTNSVVLLSTVGADGVACS